MLDQFLVVEYLECFANQLAKMKALITVYLLVYVTTVSSSKVIFVNTECPPENPEGVLITIPHETDCDKFYVCVDGKKTVTNCPDGLHFDPETGTCDWPEVVNCNLTSVAPSTTESIITTQQIPTNSPTPQPPQTTSEQIPTNPPTTQPPQTTSEQIPTNPPTTQPPQSTTKKPNTNPPTTQPPQTTTQQIPTNPPTTQPPQTTTQQFPTNPPTTQLPDPTTPSWSNPRTCIGECPLVDPISYTVQLPNIRCDKFCKCSNGDAYVMSCPENLHYNRELEVCDWPENANCTGIGGIPITTTPPQAKRQNIQVRNVRETPVETTTPEWQNPLSCIGDCPLIDPLNYTIHLPNIRCDKFCKCSNGIAYVQSCPEKLHYNKNFQVCDWPRFANCTGIGGIPPLTSTDNEQVTDDKSQDSPPSFFKRMLHLW